MNQSDDIKELVSALSKAQGTMEPARFNRVNPHFKNRYADFTSCMDACRIPLCENGLSIMQYCETINDKLTLITMLAHVSGQWIKSNFPLIAKTMDSQGIGSAMTYAKRYSLSAMLGIVSDEEDDDAEAAQGRTQTVKAAPTRERISAEQINIIMTIEAGLDEECKRKLYSWLKACFKIDKLQEITTDNYKKVLSAFDNACKFMQQNKREVAHA